MCHVLGIKRRYLTGVRTLSIASSLHQYPRTTCMRVRQLSSSSVVWPFCIWMSKTFGHSAKQEKILLDELQGHSSDTQAHIEDQSSVKLTLEADVEVEGRKVCLNMCISVRDSCFAQERACPWCVHLPGSIVVSTFHGRPFRK
eukprot:5272825-Amphidinium_carterae.1